MQWKFKGWKATHNFSMHEARRIVILWDPRLATVKSIKVTAQVIYASVTCKISHKRFLVSFVYGLHSVVGRRPLCQSLVQFGTNQDNPWFVLGDFNSVLNTNNRQGRTKVFSYEVRDFSNCCVDLGLVDINSTGSHD